MGPPVKKTKQDREYPGFSDKAHPDVFNLKAMPAQPKKLKPGQLSEDKVISKEFLKSHDTLADCHRPLEEQF